MGKFIDLTGQHFNRLTVLSRAEKTDCRGNVYWNCKCDCGNTLTVSTCHLKRGHTKSCGCFNSEAASKRALKNLLGLKFGRLTVIERAENKDNVVCWKCLCDCGNEVIVRSGALTSGSTKSCGCFNRERTSERKLKNLVGIRFGKLIVVSRATNAPNGSVRWNCRCDCGKSCVVNSRDLTSGDTKSCGCLAHKHGLSNKPIYKKWCSMIERCTNPNNPKYPSYGGRGITVCEQWCKDFKSFYDYVSQLPHFGEENYTLDRIDNNGNYEPNNVRWADRKTQGRNKRNNVVVEYEGKNITVAEASELSGIKYSTLLARLKNNASYDTLFEPVK